MVGNIVILTNGNFFSQIILSLLYEKYSLAGVVIVMGDYKARTGLKALWEIGKVTAFPYLVYKIISLYSVKLGRIIRKELIFSVEDYLQQQGIPYKKVISINSEEALSWVEGLKPDLLISVSCPQLIKKRMLSLPNLGGINIHSSLLTAYAGLAPYYWVLSKGEKVTGTTVHKLTSKFDEGNILSQKTLEIESGESAFQLFKRLAELGSEALVEAVDLVLAGDEGIKQDLTKYTYFSNPDFKSYLQLKRNGHCLMRWGELVAAIRECISIENHKKQESLVNSN